MIPSTRAHEYYTNYNLIKDFKNELQKNFGTIDGELIKEAVERVVALYAEADPKAQPNSFEGNPAMIRLRTAAIH